MSIRFKFRSSVNFDSVQIDNRSYISVAELRSKILRGKNSQQGFDLVFSDAVNGLEYKGDDTQIPSGSSVIVKRVPGVVATPSTEALKIIDVKDSHVLKPCVGKKEDFLDFGVGIASVPDSELPKFDLEIDTDNLIGNEIEDIPCLRLECQKLDSSDISLAIPRGSNPHIYDKNIVQEDKAVEQKKLNKLPTSNILAVQSSNLPLELKCPLCQTFFQEAVMIPCCQHSFCDKCIRIVLTEKGRCPKCFSSKCNVGDLLPNLSLRQAIDHFLESQMHDADIEKAMQKYVPDGESGIHARDVSCALTVQREHDLPQSSFATGNKLKQTSGLRGGHPYHSNMQRGYEDYAPLDGFQGENQPFVVPQTSLHGLHGAGGQRNFPSFGGQKKVRTCYTCGSPEHLMRDCPASHPNPMFQPGDGAFHGGMPEYAPYWNSSSMPPFRLYGNMYGNPAAAMASYNAQFQVSPYGIPPYMSSMYGGMPPGPGNMRPRHSENYGLQHSESNRSIEDFPREQLSDNEDSPEPYRHSYPEKSHDYKPQKRNEPTRSYSGESLTRNPDRRTQHDKYAVERHEKSSHSFAGRDKKPRAERSNSGMEELSRSEGKHRHHGESKKYHHERRERNGSDLSLGNRSAQKEAKIRAESDVRDTHKKPRSHSDYSYEPTSPHEQRHRYKGDSGHDSRHYGHSGKQSRDSDFALGNRSAQKDVKRREGSDFKDSHKKPQSHSDYSFKPTSPHEQRHRHKQDDIGHDDRHYRHSEKQSRDRKHMDEEEGRDEHGHHYKRKRVY